MELAKTFFFSKCVLSNLTAGISTKNFKISLFLLSGPGIWAFFKKYKITFVGLYEAQKGRTGTEKRSPPFFCVMEGLSDGCLWMCFDTLKI